MTNRRGPSELLKPRPTCPRCGKVGWRSRPPAHRLLGGVTARQVGFTPCS
jgi:hypothetical protein